MTIGTQSPPRSAIRALPALLVNQIAAGEVVDRPASVVKELVENAIDAGARRIVIELEQGGVELIRVTDDGSGIPESELALAIAPHATSKITLAEDLDRIATMGFRGEALASIASVSRMSVRSRTREQSGAAQIDIEGDVVSPVRPAPGAQGTAVTVRNLFFNTPARRKFLRTPATEQGHGVDVASSLAISHPAIGFTILCDGRRVLEVAPEQSPRQRALEVLGTELGDQMIEISADAFDDTRGIALWGLVGRPEIARATAKAQHLYLNGRIIRDKTVQHALREAYRGLIEPGRYPTAIVMLEMSPGAVDVNVHPSKAEVRFRDQSMVHGVVLRSVRDALRAADLTPVVDHHAPRSTQEMFGTGLSGQNLDAHASLPVAIHPEALVEFLRKRPSAAANADGAAASEAHERTDGLESNPLPSIQTPERLQEPSPHLVRAPVRHDPVLQVHNSFVVTQDEQGLLIVDQHALHERVMFEALLTRVAGAAPADAPETPALESQRLLVPAVVTATRRQVSRIATLDPLLKRIGIAAEPLGPESIGVHSFPTFLFDRNVDPVDFLSELFDRADADDFAPNSEEALHEVLDMMACKAAIKAGDRLSELELRELLRFRETVERSSNCPHGRPTSIRLTIKELEKRFGRI